MIVYWSEVWFRFTPGYLHSPVERFRVKRFSRCEEPKVFAESFPESLGSEASIFSACRAFASHRASPGGNSASNAPLQSQLGGVKLASMKPEDSSAAPSRSDITPKWVDSQTCLITC